MGKLEKLKKEVEELRWRLEIDALRYDREKFNKKYIEREEYDKLLSQWESAVAEAKFYKNKAQQLQVENKYLKRKVTYLKALLSDARDAINTLEEKMARQAIEIFKSIKSIKREDSTEIEEDSIKVESKKPKSSFRQLVERALKKNLNEVSKSTDINASKDYTFIERV